MDDKADQLRVFLYDYSQRNLDTDIDTLEEKARQFNDLMLGGAVSQSDVDQLVGEVTRAHQVVSRAGATLQGVSGHRPWLKERLASGLELKYWNEFRRYQTSQGRSPHVLNTLDEETSEIAELLGDPLRLGEWRRKGLVIGEVQSGKTASYIGVANKALDLGYKMIVILGGHTNDLRGQTQSRVDTDLLGFDTRLLTRAGEVPSRAHRGSLHGVAAHGEARYFCALTSAASDFNRRSITSANIPIHAEMDPAIAVVKKNKSVLTNLRDYLKSRWRNGQRLDIPLLLIDDESDWASINTANDPDEATAINRAIRDILDCSTRSSYLAITATPFANILIDDNPEGDLFPADYIKTLSVPSNYIGVSRMVNSSSSDDLANMIVSDVDDMLELLPYRHDRHAVLETLPNSLKRAIDHFIVATAIRLLRTPGLSSSSMLINVSRFMDVQDSVRVQVENYLRRVTITIEAEVGRGGTERSIYLQGLAEAFERIVSDVPITWDQVEAVLPRVLSVTGVRVRNTRANTESRQAPETAKFLINIGGDVLARGLTLENLLVSYYVRNVSAADTLLQMGRWFGYRDGYTDLVRVWIDQATLELFEYAAEISQDIRRDIHEMSALSRTPREFGLMIRQHPESFRITAINKSRSGASIEGEVKIAGQTFESDLLPRSRDQLQSNVAAAARLADELASSCPLQCVQGDGSNQSNLKWRGVPARLVESFLEQFEGHEAHPYFGRSSVHSGAQLRQALLAPDSPAEWDVVFVGGSETEVLLGSSGLKVKTSLRSKMDLDAPIQALRLANRRVGSAADFLSILSADELEAYKSKYSESADGFPDGTPLWKQRSVFLAREGARPALFIYHLVNVSAEGQETVEKHPSLPVSSTLPAVGVVVAFPSHIMGSRSRVRFIANTVYQRALREEMLTLEEGPNE